MKHLISLIFSSLLMLSLSVAAQSHFVNSPGGLNLRSGPGTNHPVMTTLPHNAELHVLRTENGWSQVEYRGQRGYVSSSFLSDRRNQASSASSSGRTPASSRPQNNSSGSSFRGSSAYTTGLGVRGGFTSGLTFKHFHRENAAMEFILGSRWHGVSLSGLYEGHSRNALGSPQLSWVYGIGAQAGFYHGRHYYYRYHPRHCNDPYNPRCYAYWKDRSFTAVGLVGIGGLEYQFRDIPFTISFDLMPYYYFYHWGGSFIDGSFSLRYIIK